MSTINEMQKKMYATGVEVQNHFISLAEKEGYACVKSNPYEDKKEHWDVKLIKNGNIDYVDIKGEKNVTKNGFTWIETQNVAGDTGWLYGSKLTAIVFEREDRFDFVDVVELRKLIDENIVDKHEIVFLKPDDISELQYRRYRRLGRFDIVVLTPFADIDKFIIKTIYK